MNRSRLSQNGIKDNDNQALMNEIPHESQRPRRTRKNWFAFISFIICFAAFILLHYRINNPRPLVAHHTSEIDIVEHTVDVLNESCPIALFPGVVIQSIDYNKETNRLYAKLVYSEAIGVSGSMERIKNYIRKTFISNYLRKENKKNIVDFQDELINRGVTIVTRYYTLDINGKEHYIGILEFYPEEMSSARRLVETDPKKAAIEVRDFIPANIQGEDFLNEYDMAQAAETVMPSLKEIEEINSKLPSFVSQELELYKVEYDFNKKIEFFYYRYVADVNDESITPSLVDQLKEKIKIGLLNNPGSMARINAGMTYTYEYISTNGTKLYDIRIDKYDF